MKRFKKVKPTVKVKYRYPDRTEVSYVKLSVEDLVFSSPEVNEAPDDINVLPSMSSSSEEVMDTNQEMDDDIMNDCSLDGDSDDPDANVSSYQRKKERRCLAWDGIRQHVLRVAVESEGTQFCEHNLCRICSSTNAVCRCKDCGPSCFFCEECAVTSHTNTNI